MKPLHFITMLILALALPALAAAATPREIDAKVNAALDRFHREIPGADRILADAKAVLVLPEVLKGGFIVGGQYGEGALLEGHKVERYYNIASASFGLTAGGEMKDIVIVFYSAEALKKFRARDGWEAGVDGNIAVIKKGTGATAEATRIQEPIVGYVVGVKGLIVDASLQGSKFSVIHPE